jgi:hypothetical protein
MPRIVRYLRPLSAVMFAIYSAVLVLWGEAASELHLKWYYIHLPVRVVDTLLLRTCGIVVFRGYTFLTFLGDWAFMAAFILISVCLLHSIKAMRPFLFLIFGVVAFAGPLYTRDCLMFVRYSENWWQWGEVAAALGCAILFSFGRGPRLAAPVIPIAVSIHFGCWFFFQWSGSTWCLWQLSTLLILPSCLALSWAFCVRDQQWQVSQTTEAPTPK